MNLGEVMVSSVYGVNMIKMHCIKFSELIKIYSKCCLLVYLNNK